MDNGYDYVFTNGYVSITHRVSPNGTPEAVIQLWPRTGSLDDLFREVSAWVKTQKIGGLDVDHTILLVRHTDAPYMVAFKAVGYE